jgi:hypothetical protein
MDMPALQAEVTQAQKAALAVEANHIAVVLTIEISAQEAAAAQDSFTIRVKDAEGWATLAKREARERVSRVEADNAVSFYAHEDPEGLVRKIAHLEGELVEACQARDVAEENSRGLFDMAANARHRYEVSERERREHYEELTLL